MMNQLEALEPLTESFAAMSVGEFPVFQHSMPRAELCDGRYRVRFARTPAELDAVQKLRFEVFNLELGEGLDAAYQTGRDGDEFDQSCHHLMVVDTSNDRVVGTYRMQTGEMADANRGFYSAGEYDFSSFPSDVLWDSIELGRACIAKDHRNTQVLFLLWKGLAAYLAHNRKRYLFGCCSLTSQNARQGLRVLQALEAGQQLHPRLWATARPEYECIADEADVDETIDVNIPKLFKTYLRFGARVCSPPALDRAFKTIDFLVLFDVYEMDASARRLFFGT
jgi:putative hemolysin